GTHAGCDDARGLDETVQDGPYAAHHGEAHREANRARDLPGQLLSPQGPARQGDVPDSRGAVRRPGADVDGRAVDAAGSRAQEPTAPVIVVETSQGTFAFETYPEEAPKTVTHIVDLVRRGFYDGQRVHRAIPGFLIQWGDPQSRDPSKEAVWGRGPAASSGSPIGAAEMSKKRTHSKGAVALSHPGNPAQ